jgi:hypothetical protein
VARDAAEKEIDDGGALAGSGASGCCAWVRRGRGGGTGGAGARGHLL